MEEPEIIDREEFLFEQTKVFCDVVVQTLKETNLNGVPVVTWTLEDLDRFLNHLLFNHKAAIAKDNPERAAEVLQETEGSSKEMAAIIKEHFLSVINNPDRKYMPQ